MKIYLGTNTTHGLSPHGLGLKLAKPLLLLAFTFELFKLPNSGIYKQVQASEFIPIVFGWGGWGCFRISGVTSGHVDRCPKHRAGLGHVQGAVSVIFEWAEVR